MSIFERSVGDLPPLLFLGAGVLAGLIAERLLRARLTSLATGADWKGHHVLLRALRGMPVLWLALAGAFAAVPDLPLAPAHAELAHRVLIVLFIGSLTLFASRLASGFVALWTERLLSGTTSILSTLAVLAVWALGGLMLLETLGVSVTPILTALGVGGLAVALALKETLSNLFAGIQILASRQVRVGDYVRLDSGDEGYVADIQWRNTSVRSLSNNMIIVPNAKLAESIVTNTYRPDRELAVLVEVSVAYGCDLGKVERIAAEVGAEVMKEVPGGTPDFAPFIRHHTFGDSGVQFTWILRAREFADQYLVKHEAIQRLDRRFREEGIEIPYPTRSVRWRPDPSVASVDPPTRPDAPLRPAV